MHTRTQGVKSIGVVWRNLQGMKVNLTEKGGILWETRAEKRIKTKVKSRKPFSRPKRRRGKIAESFSFTGTAGFA